MIFLYFLLKSNHDVCNRRGITHFCSVYENNKLDPLSSQQLHFCSILRSSTHRRHAGILKSQWNLELKGKLILPRESVAICSFSSHTSSMNTEPLGHSARPGSDADQHTITQCVALTCAGDSQLQLSLTSPPILFPGRCHIFFDWCIRIMLMLEE